MERASSAEYIRAELQARQLSENSMRSASLDAGSRRSLEPHRPQHIAVDMNGSDSAQGDVSRIEPLMQHKRITVEIRNLSAYVPSLFGQPSLLQRMNPRTIRKVKAAGGSLRRPKINQILFDVSGRVRPGEVLALMGPSGSGKTTVLSIAGGRAQKSMTVKGSVAFNGNPLDKTMKRRIGYVMQDDLLYESLTVKETLYYAAMLRLPRDMPREEKLARVDAILDALGLDKCKDTITGGFFHRGISGGERKRTSVGHELIINPAVLFLDEPTSGLDSTTSFHLLGTLRKLAEGGRTIITTIHQPSSRLYQQLDKLLLLSGGHAMYYGNARHAVDYFEQLGFPIPPRVNAADFILDLASGEMTGIEVHVDVKSKNGESYRQYLVDCAETFLSEHPMDGFELDRDVETVQKVRKLTSGEEEHHHVLSRRSDTVHVNGVAGNAALPTIPSGHTLVAGGGSPESSVLTTGTTPDLSPGNGAMIPPPSSKFASNKFSSTEIDARPTTKRVTRGDSRYVSGDESRWGASFYSQVGLLFERSLRTRRFQSLSTQDICQFLIIAVLAGLFWLQKGQGETVIEARDTLGVLFFMLMFLSFRSLFVSLFTFPEEHRHMLKERASGMYRLSAFYLARTLSDFPADMSIPTGFILVVYFMAGLRYNAAAFFGVYGTLLLSMFVAQSLGLLLGAIFMNPKTAQTVAAVLMLTIILTGGFFVVDIPSWIGWLKWFSYVYYALGILLFIQFDGGNSVVYSCTGVGEAGAGQCSQVNVDDPQTNPACVPVDDLQASLGLLQDPSSSGDAIRNGMILLAFFVLLRIAVYYVLRRKTAGF